MAIASFSKSASSFKITETGKRKLKRIETEVPAAMERAMRRTMPKFKRLLASYSPTPAQEEQLLSEGTIFEGRYVSRGPRKGQLEPSDRFVGTPRGGRFLRQGGMKSLRAAIEASEVVSKVTGGRVTVTTARAAEINRRTGFSWRTRKRGIQGPTYPYDHRLMQSFEDGGVWEVRRRTAALLNPAPGVLAGRMIKTLVPWGMYRQARVAIKDDLAKAIENAVKRTLKEIQ